MKTVAIDKITDRVPESFGELLPFQLLAIGQVFVFKFDRPQARVWLASQWCSKLFRYNERCSLILKKLIRTGRKKQLPISQLHGLQSLLEETELNRHNLAMLTNWFDQEHVSDRWIIDRIILRKHWIFSKTVQGPSLRLGNIQFWEWCKAETYLNRYNRTQKREDFNKFLACLFHEVKAGKRPPFDEQAVDELAPWFNCLPAHYICAIQLNYAAIKRWLAAAFPNVFEKGNENSNAVPDFAELLLRSARMQQADEDHIGKKPLLVELKKLELAAKDAKERSEAK